MSTASVSLEAQPAPAWVTSTSSCGTVATTSIAATLEVATTPRSSASLSGAKATLGATMPWSAAQVR